MGKSYASQRPMADLYVPLRCAVALLMGFGLGCAIIHACGGQPLAALSSDINMAVQPMQASRFMHPKPFQGFSPRSQRVLPPMQALTPRQELELQDEIKKMEAQTAKQGRRGMIAGLVTAAGLESQKARAEMNKDRADFPYLYVLIAPVAVFAGIWKLGFELFKQP